MKIVVFLHSRVISPFAIMQSLIINTANLHKLAKNIRGTQILGAGQKVYNLSLVFIGLEINQKGESKEAPFADSFPVF